jgi:hypothetical protein
LVVAKRSRVREQDAKVFPHCDSSWANARASRGSHLEEHVLAAGDGFRKIRPTRRRRERRTRVHRVDDDRSKTRVKECVQRLSSLSPGALRCPISTLSWFKSCAMRSTRS